MKDVGTVITNTEAHFRAVAVAAGLMTEQQAEKWIVVRAGELGDGAFDMLPTICSGCGHEHSYDELVPMEINFSSEVPESVSSALIRLVQQPSIGTIN